jgi:LmbE family N-acetylglucosaminyl deacetylase
MRWIIISPHFDDAVLSCGGLIWEAVRRGVSAEIWTVCAGYPASDSLSELAGRIHAQWRTGDVRETINLRRAEDRAAAAEVGAAFRHFSTPDCIYRTDSSGAFLYTDDVFDPPHPADAGLPDRIAAELASELVADDQLLCPLTVGHHVDHVLTRAAVERLQKPMGYYADIPYLMRFPEELPATSEGLSEDLHPVSPRGLFAWQRGVAAYASQIRMLFGNEPGMRRQIRAYWAGEHGARLWSRPADAGLNFDLNRDIVTGPPKTNSL